LQLNISNSRAQNVKWELLSANAKLFKNATVESEENSTSTTDENNMVNNHEKFHACSTLHFYKMRVNPKHVRRKISLKLGCLERPQSCLAGFNGNHICCAEVALNMDAVTIAVNQRAAE
jgi:hypothetical protein